MFEPKELVNPHKRIYDMLWNCAREMRRTGYSERAIGQCFLAFSTWVAEKGGPGDYYKQLLWCEAMGEKWRREFEERFAGEIDFEELRKTGKVEKLPRTIQ